MSSPVVENVRTVPLIVEGCYQRNIPMDIEYAENSGYPFERASDRDNYLRSQLDDIAKRHPEFAEHLGNFSQRDHRQRQSPEDVPEFRRRFPRHFDTDRFEQFGFPFDPEEYAQQFYQPHQNFPQEHQQQPQPSSAPPAQEFAYNPYQQQEQSHQQQPAPSQPQPQPQQQQQQQPAPQSPECSQPVQQETTQNPASNFERGNIQQSNTIDLGQKQEPETINDRSQRSMSAPPAEKAQRFTSSIHIPVNQPQQQPSENMAQSQPHSDAKSSHERIIPIHIEGRDEPVLPKNIPPEYVQQHSHPEKIFGQRPEQFTQFLNREPRFGNNWHSSFPEEPMRQQRFHPQQNTFHHHQPQHHQPPPPKEDIPIPVQKEVPVQKQQHQQQFQQPSHANQQQQHQQPQQQQQQKPAPPQEPQEPPKPAPTQQKPLTPIEQIQEIQKDVSNLMSLVEQFDGKYKDRQYLYLDEMFTRNMIKLDNIDTQGQENIRSARKEAIKCIEKAIGVLESKAMGNQQAAAATEAMEIEPAGDGQSTTTENVEEKEPAADAETPEAPKVTEDVPMKEESGKEEVPNNSDDTVVDNDSNMSVSDAVKKFEAIGDEEKEKDDSVAVSSSPEQGEADKPTDVPLDTKEEEAKTNVDSDKEGKKKDKKKGKKKADKEK